jgi:hypothetical protein
MAYDPAPYNPPPAAPATAAGIGSRRPLFLAAAAGFALAAVIAIGLAVAGVLPSNDDSGTSGTSAASITLPKTLGSYVRFADVKLNHSSRAAKSVANEKNSDAKTASALSAAYDGAGAAVQVYADQKLATTVAAWAVRGPTPRPVVAYVDAKYLGLAQSPHEIKKVGSSYCSISTIEQTPAGQTPPPSATHTDYCQRSSDSLTVTVYAYGDSTLAQHPDQVAALVDQVWLSIS